MERRGWKIRSQPRGSRSRWRRNASLMRRLMRLRSWALPRTLPAVSPTRGVASEVATAGCAARNQLIGELDSDRYASFVEEMAAFLDAGAHSAATMATPTAPHRVRDRAASEIWASYETVRAYELVFPWADLETLHDLRIATKWLRYDLEFFGETLGAEAVLITGRVGRCRNSWASLNPASSCPPPGGKRVHRLSFDFELPGCVNPAALRARLSCQSNESPPSTAISWPVTKDAAGLQRKAITPATSSAVPIGR